MLVSVRGVFIWYWGVLRRPGSHPFFFFLFFFEVIPLPFKVTSKQTSKWQQKGKCCLFMASPLMNRTALGWVTSLCLRLFQRRSEAFILQCLQYRWKRECLYSYYLCLSVPGSKMCLFTGDWCLLSPSFAAELWTVPIGEGERMGGVCAQHVPTGSTRVPSLCVLVKTLRSAALWGDVGSRVNEGCWVKPSLW